MAKTEPKKKTATKTAPAQLPKGYEVVSDAQVEIVGWLKPVEDVPLVCVGKYVKTVYPRDRDTSFHIVELILPQSYVFSDDGEEIETLAGQNIGIDHKAFMEPMTRMRPGQELALTFEGKTLLKNGNTPWNGRVAVPSGQRTQLDAKAPRVASSNGAGRESGKVPF